jgi:hypothetical protein
LVKAVGTCRFLRRPQLLARFGRVEWSRQSHLGVFRPAMIRESGILMIICKQTIDDVLICNEILNARVPYTCCPLSDGMVMTWNVCAFTREKGLSSTGPRKDDKV